MTIFDLGFRSKFKEERLVFVRGMGNEMVYGEIGLPPFPLPLPAPAGTIEFVSLSLWDEETARPRGCYGVRDEECGRSIGSVSVITVAVSSLPISIFLNL
jgi:hypothetical protein